MAADCRITGPNYIIGDIEWHCRKHEVDTELKDPSQRGMLAHNYRREMFYCPKE